MSGTIRVAIAAEAERDLQLIYDQRLRIRGAPGPDCADALLDRLFEAMARLADFPLSGPVPPELEALGIAGWRQISEPPCRIIYAVESDTVTVAVIADGRRDFSALLERRLLQSPARGK